MKKLKYSLRRVKSNGRYLWYIRSKEPGYPNVESLGAITKNEAEMELARWNVGQKKVHTALTFREIEHDVFKDLELKVRSKIIKPGTRQLYQYHRDKLLHFFGDATLSEITRRDIELYKHHLVTQHKFHPRTVNISLTQLRKIYDYAIEMDIIDQIPVIKRMHEPKSKSTPYITHEQYRHCIEYFEITHPIMALYLKIAYYTGMRCEELNQMTWDNVSFKDSTIFIPETSPKKPGGYIPLLPELKALLEPISKRSGYILPYRRTDVWRRIMERHRDSLKIKITPKMLRKSVTNILIDRGVDFIFVKNLLRHRNAQTTTDNYAELNAKQIGKRLTETNGLPDIANKKD